MQARSNGAWLGVSALIGGRWFDGGGTMTAWAKIRLVRAPRKSAPIFNSVASPSTQIFSIPPASPASPPSREVP